MGRVFSSQFQHSSKSSHISFSQNSGWFKSSWKIKNEKVLPIEYQCSKKMLHQFFHQFLNYIKDNFSNLHCIIVISMLSVLNNLWNEKRNVINKNRHQTSFPSFYILTFFFITWLFSCQQINLLSKHFNKK